MPSDLGFCLTNVYNQFGKVFYTIVPSGNQDKPQYQIVTDTAGRVSGD